jgi:hypothetical protein
MLQTARFCLAPPVHVHQLSEARTSMNLKFLLNIFHDRVRRGPSDHSFFQEREGFSIPAQQKLLRQYAREHKLTVIREFVDVETAKRAGRNGFGEMLAFLKSDSSCRTILVEKTDRLYRNIKDWITVDELDLAVHFVKENAIRAAPSYGRQQARSRVRGLRLGTDLWGLLDAQIAGLGR